MSSQKTHFGHLEKIEDAGGLLESVRLPKLVKLGQSSLQVAVGAQTNSHCHSLTWTDKRKPVAQRNGKKSHEAALNRPVLCLTWSRDILIVTEYLSLNGVIVPRCQENLLQLLSHHFLIKTLLESHSYTSVQETLETE